MHQTSNRTVVRARELRRSLSLPEGLLWRELRKRPSGFKFRRQHPLGPFVVDFYCPAGRLAIEVDGASHDMGDRPRRDGTRDRWLRTQDVRILRFDAREVFDNMDGVIRMIVAACSEGLPLPHAAHGPPPHLAMGRN